MAYEIRISDWSSDVCSSDLLAFFKISRTRTILVVLNLSNTQQIAHIEDSAIPGIYKDVFSGIIKEAPPVKKLLMEPWSYLVLEKIGRATCRERVCQYV